VIDAFAMVLACLWLLGVGTAVTLGGLIHLLLLIALVAVVTGVIRSEPPA
jgi:hypothetical protein